MCMPCEYLMLVRARRDHGSPWNWNYRQLWAIMSSGKLVSAVNHLALCIAIHSYNHVNTPMALLNKPCFLSSFLSSFFHCLQCHPSSSLIPSQFGPFHLFDTLTARHAHLITSSTGAFLLWCTGALICNYSSVHSLSSLVHELFKHSDLSIYNLMGKC